MNRLQMSIVMLLSAQASFLALVGCASTPSAAPAREHAQIVGVVNELFEGMRTKDEATLDRVLDDELALVAIDERSGTTVTSGTKESFIRGIVNSPRIIHEVMWDAEVRLDGDLATLWAPYELWLDDQFSHCGFDSIQLVRNGDGWRIVGVAYTRRSEGCDPGERVGPG